MINIYFKNSQTGIFPVWPPISGNFQIWFWSIFFQHSGSSDFLKNLWATQTSIKTCKISSEIKFIRFLFSMLLLNVNIFFKVTAYVSTDYHALMSIAWLYLDLNSKSRSYCLGVFHFSMFFLNLNISFGVNAHL